MHPTDKTFSSCLLCAASSDHEKKALITCCMGHKCLLSCYLFSSYSSQLWGTEGRLSSVTVFPALVPHVFSHLRSSSRPALGNHSVAHLHPKSHHTFATCCLFPSISPLTPSAR